MLELRVTIRLGNDAMLSGYDLVTALGKVTDRVNEHIGDDAPITEPTHAVSIFDENGARVGQWKIHEED